MAHAIAFLMKLRKGRRIHFWASNDKMLSVRPINSKSPAVVTITVEFSRVARKTSEALQTLIFTVTALISQRNPR